MNGTALLVRKVVHAPRERVWRAFTDAGELQSWYGLTAEWVTDVLELDVRPGGRYRIGLTPPGKARFFEVGEFREVVAPQTLVYTQQQVTEAGDGFTEDTLVTVTFEDEDGATVVTVTQDGYQDEQVRATHQAGWGKFLDRLVERYR